MEHVAKLLDRTKRETVDINTFHVQLVLQWILLLAPILNSQ